MARHFFVCHRCGTLHRIGEYRSHMIGQHDGRSDCVLNLSVLDVMRAITGRLTLFDAAQPQPRAIGPAS